MASDGLVSRTLGSLINGISQQPSVIRLASQGEAQSNCHSRPVDGVSRRSPSEFVSELLTTLPTGGIFTHFINRDEGEQYIVIIEDGDIEVYDLSDGTKATTTILGNGATYLDFDAGSLNARDQFAATTVADYTFITNRKKVLAMEGSTESVRPNEFIFHITSVPSQALDWHVFIGDDEVSGIPINSDTTITHRNTLFNALVAFSYTVGTWSFTAFGSNGIYGVQTSGDDQPVRFSNDWGDSGYKFAYKTVQKFSDLPKLTHQIEPIVLEIIGTDGDEDSNYWVLWDAVQEVWAETVGTGLDNDFDGDTFPHQLTRTGVSPLTFDFGPASWDDRLKGDLDTAPEPSFIGKTVADVVFHKSRLGFLADESIILSETSEFFNFWPTTVTTLIESDPIDTAGTSNRVAILDWAVPFDTNLTLFSARGAIQSELIGGDTLSQGTAEVIERAAFESVGAVRPVSIGKHIYFIVDRGTSSGLMEYSMGDNERPDADDITSHVPQYVPDNVVFMAGSSNESILTIHSTDEPTKLFVYNFFFNDGRKLQSSWSEWDFGTDSTIHGIGWLSHVLYILIERADGIMLEKIDVRKITDGGLANRCHYDSLVEITGSYDAGTDLTTWTLGYEPDGGTHELVIGGVGWTADLGRILSDADFTTTPGSVTHSGDWSTYPVLIGRKYLSRYEFSKPIIEKGTNQQGSAAPVTQGRLQIRKFKLLLKKTGNILAKVALRGDDTVYEYPFSGLIIGVATVGTLIPADTDEFSFDVGGESKNVAISVESDSYLPFTISGAEWEGYFTTRSQHV